MTKFKKPVSVLLAVLMIVGMFAAAPFSASAAELPDVIKDCTYQYYCYYANVPIIDPDQDETFSTLPDGDIVVWPDAGITVVDAKGYDYKFYDNTGVELPASMTDNETMSGSDFGFSADVTPYRKTFSITFSQAALDSEKLYIVATAPATDPDVENVIALIDAIGTVEYTDASKAKIDAAKDAYDALTDTQKELVTNYTTLTDAETAYAALAVPEGTPLTDQLPSTQGTYYLTQDITISSTWLAPSGATTLDLNGYGIRMTGTGTVIDVCRDASCVLTLNDSRPTYSGGENRPSGILGGYITGGTGSKSHPGTSNASYIVGGGIYVNNAVLNINGGTIYGNSAAWGGGIYINNDCTVNMTGGAITGNSCARNGYGGGVFLSARSTFNVSHTPSIIGNYYSYNGKEYPRNVHMQVSASGGKPLYAVITIVSPGLTAGAQIGIYEYQTNQYHVTSGYSTYHSGVNPGTYFSCDNAGYAYIVNEGELLSVPAFTITWLNEDGSLIDTTTVAGGTVPTHADATKDATAQYTYTFAGWSDGTTTYAPDALPEAIRNATYTATFNQSDREYTITWKNDDGSVIDTTTVPYGTVPTHADATKDADAQYSYTFAGWDTAPVAVTGDATYTATFTTSASPAAIVIGKIDAIGTVEYTDACKAKIDAARNAYDALTDEQKALVNNYQTLLDAEAAYQAAAAASVQDWQSVTIADEIYINFIPSVRDDLESITVEYIDQGKVTQTLTYNDPENQLEKYDATHYLIPVEVAPAQIGDTIKATLKITGSNSIALDTSIAEYCNALIDGNFEQKYKDLAAATLEYGQAANNHFAATGFYTANTFAGTEKAQAAVDAVANMDSTMTLDVDGKIVSASFMALTRPEFRFHTTGLTEAEAVALNGKITVDGPNGVAAQFVKSASTGAILLEVTGIEAATMDQAVTITIDGFGTLTFCGNDFARLMAKNAATAVLGAALYNYGAAAKACFTA